MSVPFEKEYEDVLQNIEHTIVSAYREEPEISDWTVETALDGLTKTYLAEMRGRTPPRLRLDDREQALYDRLQTMCEWRLGRSPMTLEDEQGNPVETDIPPITLDEIIACLKRIQLSVKRWHKQGGRRGYLEFVSQYVM